MPALLASLGRQYRPADEVIVVDDHSSDATADLARAWGATVVSTPALPDGWTGKTWACHRGSQAADGDVLVFLDADVTLAPEALGVLLAELRRSGGLVSLEPHHRTEALYERLSAVCNVVTLMATGAFAPLARGEPASPMAFGPCMVIAAADYRRAGGHSHPRVRGMIAEDVGIATEVRRLGLAVTLFAGRGVASFRMYPGGLPQLVEGWTKVLGTGARRTSPLWRAGAFMWVTASLGTAGGLLLHPGKRSLLAYAAWSAQVAWMLRRVGRFGAVTALAFPVPLVAFVVLFARSACLGVLGRPLRWRGRSVVSYRNG